MKFKPLLDILIIGWLNGWIPLFRGWIWIVSNIMTPLSILVVLTIYAGERGLAWGLAGGLIWAIASNGISLIGDAVYYRIALRFQQMLAAAPVSPLSYALGLALSAFIFSTPAVAIYVGALSYLGFLNLENSLSIAASLFMLWLSTAGWGYTASTLVRQMKYAWAIPNILSVLLSVAAPVYYPAYLFPTPFLGLILPTGPTAVIIHSSFGLVKYNGLLIQAAWATSIIHASLSLALLSRTAAWRQKY